MYHRDSQLANRGGLCTIGIAWAIRGELCTIGISSGPVEDSSVP